ncbi:ABC transporter ATP-binding protein [Nocardioides marmotae]|uniref:ATP-binding cassette domain-containing protein n=1 Tax=Nocardioides marmotae TaxID=2663857 RepID=A0A6I3IXS8_9ACTN|nr:ABC transporter ATP-binding protein [Nocardioides marmotae]MCR6030275.1 ATP-binding cassette domain-containing protein [Gordonia jinghuaiqii]MBC9734434.1 ABC transporter ATP-binding protein [Nocardioides marmotae]MTB85534.1 ATP-binding cassette domain-containing protein [Nocardioides marmotae]MTB93907.1 ATP-binding cassette domain-containing protein [Nocardioides marmotae]QKE00228.1 ABC transporter ATP-binding protein [Nocardioides marmotae]
MTQALVDSVSDLGPATPKLRIENVGKEFELRKGARFKALSDITFDVARGEFVSVVGPSGCGKSTLLRMIAGLDVPSTGSIEISQDVPGRSPTAVVFQEYSIFPWKSVEENVAFGLRMRGEKRKDALVTARSWLKKVNLGGFEKSYPATLSGGMKQRVAVARALALDPEVLLLDEPFAALDAQMREVLQEELLEQWQDDGNERSAMLVTHSLDEAILLGDTVVLMSATPGVVRARYDVPFERPRSPHLRGTKEFAELRDLIWNDLREEVLAASRAREAADKG